MTPPDSPRPFEWDEYSDQPKIILDKAFKWRMRHSIGQICSRCLPQQA